MTRQDSRQGVQLCHAVGIQAAVLLIAGQLK